MIREKLALGASLGAFLFSVLLSAQAPPTPPRRPAPEPWRFAGARPCVGPEGGVLQISTLHRPGRGSLYTQQPGLPPYVITLDPESVLARCEAAGVDIVSPMEYVPYGVPGDRGFSIRDPEGNVWAVGTYGATPR